MGLLSAALLALILPWTLLARDVGMVFFSPQLISDQIIEHWVTNPALRQEMSRQFAKAMLRGMLGVPEEEPLPLPELAPQDLDAIAAIVLPRGWLEGQVRHNVDAFFAWLGSDEPVPDLRLDLVPIRQALMGGGAHRLVKTILDLLPPCTTEEMQELFAALEAGDQGAIPVCSPPPALQEDFVRQATLLLREQAAALPDSLPLGGDLLEGGSLDELLLARDALATARLVLRWLWLIPGFLMAWLLLINIRSWRGLGLWWGVPLFLGGGQGLLLALGGAALSQGMVFRRMARMDLPDGVEGPAFSLFEGLLEEVFSRLLLQSGLVLLIALGLLLLAVLAGRGQRAPKLPGETQPQPPASPSEPPPVEPPSFLEGRTVEGEEDPAEGRPPGMFG
jgi:hypothetical protein